MNTLACKLNTNASKSICACGNLRLHVEMLVRMQKCMCTRRNTRALQFHAAFDLCTLFFLDPFSITRTVSFNFFTPFIAMKKRRSNNLFGGPSSFSGATLPTYGEVGKQWAQTRMDLESQNPGARITNVEVAKQVCH